MMSRDTLQRGVRIARLAGIDVRAHWSVVVVAVLLGASLVRTVDLSIAALAVAGFLVSIVAHEFGHALTARHYGVDTESIQLWALGGVARLTGESPSARAEGWIAAAGPIVSVALAVVGLGAWWQLGGSGSASVYVGLFGWLGLINAILAVFNLLPGAPLDGGRILKAVRWSMHGDRYRAMGEAASAGEVLAVLLGVAGLALTVVGNGGVWLLVTAAFLWVNARLEGQMSKLADRLASVSISDVTWRGVAAAGPDMDADSMLWQRRRLGGAGGVSVTDDDGRQVGLVLERDLWSIPADERPWVMLTELMTPLDRTTRVELGDPLSSVLARLDPEHPMVTVWDGPRLIGMVPPNVLDHHLGITP